MSEKQKKPAPETSEPKTERPELDEKDIENVAGGYYNRPKWLGPYKD